MHDVLVWESCRRSMTSLLQPAVAASRRSADGSVECRVEISVAQRGALCLDSCASSMARFRSPCRGLTARPLRIALVRLELIERQLAHSTFFRR